MNFYLIVGPLLRFKQNNKVKLTIFGGVKGFDKPFKLLANSYKELPRLDYEGMLSFLRKNHLIIFPLEDNYFNDCKSPTKFIEAASQRTILMVSNVGDYKRSLTNEVDAFLCHDADEWFAQMQKISNMNAEELTAVASAVRKHALSNYSI